MKRILRSKQFLIGFSMLFVVVFLALVGPYLVPHDPYAIDTPNRLQAPSRTYIFGTDTFGRDIFSRIIVGARLSLVIGVIATGVGLLIGGILGLPAGYFGGRIDTIICRTIDVFMSFPYLILALIFIALLGPGLNNAMIAVGISRAPRFARLIRGQTMALRNEDFVQSARAIGATPLRIMLKHILPNTFSPILVYTSMSMATAILAAAGLGYLGLGAQPPIAEWGAMLSGGRDFLRNAWWMAAFPGAAITFTIIAFNLLGDGLRDVWDPRLKGRA